MSDQTMNKGIKSIFAGGFPEHHKDVSHIIRIPLDKLRPNPYQPRQDFDSPEAKESLQELAESIKLHGQQQPINVQKDPETSTIDKQYVIVSGERRWRAMQLLRKEAIEGRLIEGDLETLALIENIQRTDLNPIEQALSYARLKEKNHWSDGDLAQKLGKARTTVSEYLNISKIHPALLDDIRANGRIRKSHLIEIGKQKTPEEQRAIWEKLQNGQSYLDVKASRGGRTVPKTPAERAVIALQSAHKKLAKVEQLDEQSYKELREIRSAINKILKEKVPAESEPRQEA